MGDVPAYKDVSCASDQSSEFRPGYEVGTGHDTHQTIEPVDPGFSQNAGASATRYSFERIQHAALLRSYQEKYGIPMLVYDETCFA
ncbi:uncharacterized protein CLUP02_04435 [Colletotrichum lupini]|uniref:Uncharacterized protein n=1 Tax=Colletotrichum lupini TaxID=145971 RepID=A0A9Q8SLA9_9PEZI|nr:uncharacterized protein CLUP02_04435 [Colletotrichum lupini]UQC78956.1 hypothetical protein CLUP02_04435 [Colletotrichum lupini]